jgi:uncharacterized protein (TIGR02246 family)
VAATETEAALAQQVRELLDKQEIQELNARYCHAFDSGDADAFADTFVEDGVLAVVGLGQNAGHEALRASCRTYDRRVVHTTTDALIALDGDTATQVVSLVAYRRSHDRAENRFGLTARYRDQLRRTSDGWKYVRRDVTADLTPSPFGDLH